MASNITKKGSKNHISDWLVVRRVSPGRIIILLCYFKQNSAIPRQIKPKILKLTIRIGQSNLSIVFILVSCEENCYYRVVSVPLLGFDAARTAVAATVCKVYVYVCKVIYGKQSYRNTN